MWQSTAELVTATNWVNGNSGTSELTADSAVVMNGSSGWVWEVVSKSDTAGVICQRGESRLCLNLILLGSSVKEVSQGCV